MNQKLMQISVIAVAVLVIVAAAVAAVSLTAGPTEAHVTVDTNQAQVSADAKEKSRTGDNSEEYDDPVPCSEEAKPDANTAGIISNGQYAVFDAFWDYEVGHLSNNFCPPAVEHRPKQGRKPAQDIRTDANINIRQTAFSIPDSYKVTVIDTREGVSNGTSSEVTGSTIDIADFPFLAEDDAVSAVKPDPDSTAENPPNVFANNKLWWVRLDEPWTTADETSPLRISYSTDLLAEADWYLRDGPDPGTEPDPPVQYEFEAVHVLKEGTFQEAHVIDAHLFAFDQRKTDTPLQKAQWTSVDTDTNEIKMFTDQYKYMQFAFTEPGVYRVQVHVKGHVRKERNRLPNAPEDWSPVSPDDTITSPVQWYTFHVGPQADVGVTLTHTDETPNDPKTTVTDGTATFTVIAANSGPDPAEDVEVEISLPPGLEYVPPETPNGTSYECGVVAWKITGGLRSPGQTFVRFTANTSSATVKHLQATAKIRHLDRTYDPNGANDTSSAHVRLNKTKVRAPFFGGADRSIVEHAIAGSHAGDPVTAVSPEGLPLSYSLSGRCSSKFQVHSNGQITLASGQSLNFKKQWEFPIVLHVSDGVNATGAADTSIDDSIPVVIKVIDTPDEAVHPTVGFSTNPPSPVAGDQVTVRARVTGLTFEDGDPAYCRWDDEAGNRISESWGADCHVNLSSETAGTQRVKVHIKWDTGGITASTSVTWSEASSN